ncbi:hypothetical protein AMQ84_11205 [Paenibacillus riograndensis]|uniref:N-acetyltransferase domain-containing protein n=1 Tax=Paenibacillus riograndensis TaxID=483937 RepID=A0A132U2N5_9BACL|nr:GNAT family N-acetyltransferase [Paenibacillus riograndensis]KWX77805.1 hypothetical protein AMQ84_11205 [Paenibacillus riograndensis]
MLISLKNYWDRDAVERLLAECMEAVAAEIEEEVDRYLTGDSRELLGTFVNGELAGLAGIRHEPGEAIGLLHIAVQARLRGRGIGRAMIEELRRCQGNDILRAETGFAGAGFFRKNGFVVTSLGEKDPGVERFDCVLPVSSQAEYAL